MKRFLDHGTSAARHLMMPGLSMVLFVLVFLGAPGQLQLATGRVRSGNAKIENRNPPPTVQALSSGRVPSLQSPSSAPANLNQQSQTLLTDADEVFQQVSRITGLPIKSPLKKEVVNRDQMRQYLIETLHADYTPGEVHAQEAMLKAFGLVTPEFDLEKFLIKFYTEQAAGVYDARRKTMLIADWVDRDTQKVVLSHELTHALEDQNYDLQKFLQGRRDDDDATAARQAIAEGHATAAMMQMMISPQQLQDAPTVVPLMTMSMQLQIEQYPVFSSAPFFFRYQALFPYAQGMSFMQRGLKQGGWQELRDFFLHPPESTREIFDPEVYFDHQALPQLALPDPKPLQQDSRLRVVDRNKLGQLGYYCFLGQLLSEDEAKKLAPSWLADRYLIYEDPGAHHYAVVARVRWSSTEAGADFFRDLHHILVKKYPDMGTMRAVPSSGGPGDRVAVVGSGVAGAVTMIRRGDEVLWAEGIPKAQTEAMREWLSAQ